MKRQDLSRGFTLTEIAVAMAIVSIIVLGAMSMMLLVSRQVQRASNANLGNIETTIGERFLTQYLRNASLSYNVVTDTDDTGRRFWDYLPDYPRGLLTTAEAEREITLTRTGPISTIHMITRPLLDGAGVRIYDPAAAYLLEAASDEATDGDITYQGINYNGAASNLHAGLWGTGHIALYSPIALRPTGTPPSTPPRPMLKIGVINGSDLTPDTFGGTIDNRHPANDSVTLTTFDEFLRALPSTGGGAPYVMIARAQLLQLRIVRDATNSYDVLESRRWNGSAFEAPQTLSVNVESLRLRRSSVTQPRVLFELKVRDI